MSEAKHFDIACRLENSIRAGVYGDRLPPVRQLAANFEVALQTMTKALKPLVEKGLLDPGPGGTRIVTSLPRRNGLGVVTVFMLGEQSLRLPPSRDPLLTTLRQMAARDGMTLVLMWVDDAEIFQKPGFWKAGQTDGYIFLYSSFYPIINRHLNVSGTPYVVANWLPDIVNAHWVDFDWREQLFRQTEQLLEHGYRNIAYLPIIRWQLGEPFHETLWHDLCEHYGIHNYSPGPEFFGKDMEKVLRQWQTDPNGFPDVIMPNNAPLVQLAEFLDRIGAPTRILSHHDDALKHARMLYWQNNDYTALARKVWQVFREIYDGTAGTPRPHRIPGNGNIEF